MIIFKFAGYIVVELLFALNFYFVFQYSTNIISNGCCLNVCFQSDFQSEFVSNTVVSFSIFSYFSSIEQVHLEAVSNSFWPL